MSPINWTNAANKMRIITMSKLRAKVDFTSGYVGTYFFSILIERGNPYKESVTTFCAHYEDDDDVCDNEDEFLKEVIEEVYLHDYDKVCKQIDGNYIPAQYALTYSEDMEVHICKIYAGGIPDVPCQIILIKRATLNTPDDYLESDKTLSAMIRQEQIGWESN